MLSADTKRHIDAARDVLVGVAPNPTTQIDQITYALIYKFMDDMDIAAIKEGGEPSFFVEDLQEYAWSNLTSPRLGNQDKLTLYKEALTKFSVAKQLPELFRTIFRGAALPYNSPETLGLFLKEISFFDYTHPEELGNAYEYLLSIMSSQGDAGQFRTPRHIIDFVVDVLNPSKDDKVLDPSCGTAGFLVSTYNHILEQHDGLDDSQKSEKPLTPDERKKLMQNLQGYDIDPSMVRIAQVNMYLHQFKNPQIFQYDTLTSDERWDEKFDVILANPPFMTPKGGIKPHNKFGISSNRAEVLFVDYIVGHLRPKGRAGIIVPEAIIFHSGKAYKEIRKNLLETGLFAVVSLPGGIFLPYTNTRTSILFVDNEKAKQTSEVAFIKISSDGFDLGSSKKVVEDNDLPEALEILSLWKTGEKRDSKIVSYTKKSEIISSPDYSFSGNRYIAGAESSGSKWPLVALGDLCVFNPKKSEINSLPSDSDVSFVPMADVLENDFNFKPVQTRKLGDVSGSYTYFREGDILLAKVTPCFENGKLGIARGLVNQIGFGSSEFIVIRPSEQILPEILANFLMQTDFKLSGQEQMTGTGGLQRVPVAWVKEYKIPLPPMSEQKELAAKLTEFNRQIQKAEREISLCIEQKETMIQSLWDA